MRIVKLVAIAAATFILATPVAFASEGPAGQSFEIRRGDVTYTSTFAADGTYSDSQGARGTWVLEGDQLCIATANGDGAPSRFCGPYRPLEVGETSTIESDSGSFSATRTQ